jgi:AraC-like DNA-binding protein
LTREILILTKVRYEQTRSSDSTSAFVDCYWYLETDSLLADAIERVVPDGRAELILNLGEPFQSVSDGEWRRQPRFFFAGQITTPMLLRPQAGARIIGVRFRPEGAHCIFPVPMHELAGTVVPLYALAPKLDRELQRLPELASFRHQWRFVDRVLSRTARHNDSGLTFALDIAIETAGMVSMSDLAKAANLSNRHLERRFFDSVGMAPKLFCRIRRFQQVLQAMEACDANWADAAVDCGYYDQAHLIRDFRSFSGLTPACLLGPETDLAAHFVQKYAPSHFSNTLGFVSRKIPL